MSETIKGPISKLADEYGSSRRRTQRVKIAIPVIVRIPRANASFYEETTETVVVNAHGCLARLAVPLEQGQQIHIINSKSVEERACCRRLDRASSAKAKQKWGSNFQSPRRDSGESPSHRRIGTQPTESSPPLPKFRSLPHPSESHSPGSQSSLTAKRHAPALCDSICCMVPRNQFRIASSISSCVPHL